MKERITRAVRETFDKNAELEFLMEESHLFRIKLKARKLIIKSNNYWELVFLNVIPAVGEVSAIMDAYYVAGLSNTPPRDRNIKGITEIDFFEEMQSVLYKFIGKLTAAQQQ